ncbi:MAG: DUF3552 domain-containing protein, partial [Paludibacteraceae bacterium]|nr:DUF3552 domain-containing protein [Paludibacteraceae bacterium]
MDNILIIVIVAIVALAIGAAIAFVINNTLLKSRAEDIVKKAEDEAKVIFEKKNLEAREKYNKYKSEFETQVNQRNQKLLQSEQRAKQREEQLARQQSELQRAKQSADQSREALDKQKQAVEEQRRELDKVILRQQEQLETISGLSAAEAKEQLINSLKDEARTNAMSYVNDIMEEAKMNANKEAKKIVIQTIQRVASEAAIENSVTVFNIDSDEVKGRIIGREGRNIRALEAATGVEIIVDDTPEAIVLSSFDPVRREIARLALHQLVTDGRIHPARIE